MSEPRFLSRTEIEHFHEASLAMFRGSAGLRDQAGFLSAVEQPKNTFYYGRGDLFDIAAAYAFHLAQSQCFIDGNKRTGLLGVRAFLFSNGWLFEPTEVDQVRMMVGLANSVIDESAIAAWIADFTTRKT